MFRLAVPEGVHDNRVLDYLKNQKELQEGEHFKRKSDGEGLVDYIFPNMGEDMFRYIVIKLKQQGVTMIGVDTQLTERKIMKLANLLENPTPYSFESMDETSEKDVVGKIKEVLEKHDEYEIDPTGKFWMAITNIIGDYEDQNTTNSNWMAENKEQKLRKLIRKTIRQ